MTAMMLMIINLIMAMCIKFISINIIAAICWPPPLILQLFHPGLLRPHLFSQFNCFCVDATQDLPDIYAQAHGPHMPKPKGLWPLGLGIYIYKVNPVAMV